MPGRTLATPSGPVLGEPRERAEPEPHRREEAVEDEQREPEDRVPERPAPARHPRDRKSTRLNSSHGYISYAVFCLKKKKIMNHYIPLGAAGKRDRHSVG